jgi:hypothetical protein
MTQGNLTKDSDHVTIIFSMKSLYFSLLFLTGTFVFAQSGNQTNDQAATYHSEADELVSLEKVGYVSFIDNLSGIYSRPLEAHFSQVISQMHRWSSSGTAGNSGATVEELEENPKRVSEIATSLGVDGFFAAKIIKGPKGIAIKLDLFLGKDGKLFLQSEIKDFQQFDLNILKEQLDTLFSQILHRIPYSGRVLSRDNMRVTMNVGSRDGLEKGRVVSVVQIIKLTRHPRFGFMISSDKEIIGKIKVLKVDDTLSFGSVVLEKQKGVIQKGAKLDSLEFVSYTVNDTALTGPSEDNLDARADAKVAFGEGARQWKPQAEPTLGQVGARLGLSHYNQSMSLANGTELNGHDDFGPIAQIDGEIWLTQNWTAHAEIKQGIFSVQGSGGGSESLSSYALLGGYKFRFGSSIWAPYAEPFLGYQTYRIYSGGDPFTTMEYSGFKLGVQGETPVTEDGLWGAGGKLAFMFSPTMSESPGSSGASSKNTANSFSAWAYRKLTEHWKATGTLEYEIYSTNFSGTGSRTNTANTASQRYMTLSAGIYYLF